MNKIYSITINGAQILVAILLIIFSITACTGPSENQLIKNTYEVDTLFTHEGCTVYRFKDVFHSIYFTNCHGETSWRQSMGKSSWNVSVRGK